MYASMGGATMLTGLRHMRNKPFIRRITALIKKHPVAIILFIGLVILSFNIIYIGSIRPFNSDDLYWQQTIRTWRPFSGEIFYFGTKDIFVMLAPFFMFFESIFAPSRSLILFEAWFITILTFVSAYFASVYFMRKLKLRINIASLLPFIWLASFGYPLVQNYLNSDWRTLEVGIAMLTFMLVAAICFDDFMPLRNVRNKLLSVLAILYVGLVSYSDPYFLIFTLGPVLIFTVLLFALKRIDRKKLVLITVGSFASIISSSVFAYIGQKAGLHIPAEIPSAFVGLDGLLLNVANSLQGLLIIFGADFFGKQVTAPSTFGNLMNASLVAVIWWYIWHSAQRLKVSTIHTLKLPELWKIFWGIVMLFMFIVYTVSTLVLVSNYRFFVVFVYCGIIALVFTLGSKLNKLARAILVLLLLGGTCFNLSITTMSGYVKGQPNVSSNMGNALNYTLIRAVDNLHVHKGYTTYWQGNINTYLSKGTTLYLPTLCEGGQLRTFKWLVDGSQFGKPAEKSFYLYDPSYSAPPNCTPAQVIKQFGNPTKTITVAGIQILVFDYDIGSKMSHFSGFDK